MFNFYAHAFRFRGEKYERKTNRGYSKENLEKPADAVKNLGKSIRSAAKDYSVRHVQDLDSGTLLGANTDISPSALSLSSALASNLQLIFSPETPRSIPQASSTTSRTLSTGTVLYTDTPVKAALEEAAKRRKSNVKGTARRKLALKKIRIQKQNKPKRQTSEAKKSYQHRLFR